MTMHAGMLGYRGEKMSKSLGNLVFVSKLRQKYEPAVIRLALAAIPWLVDADWTDDLLAEARARLATWRAAAEVHGNSRRLGAAMSERLADGLDVPGAIAVVDDWAAAKLGSTPSSDPSARRAGGDAAARDAVEALLGMQL